MSAPPPQEPKPSDPDESADDVVERLRKMLEPDAERTDPPPPTQPSVPPHPPAGTKPAAPHRPQKPRAAPRPRGPAPPASPTQHPQPPGPATPGPQPLTPTPRHRQVRVDRDGMPLPRRVPERDRDATHV